MFSMKPYHWALASLLVGPLSSLQAQDNAPVSEENKAATEPSEPAIPTETQAGEIQDASSIEAQKKGLSFAIQVAHSVGARKDVDPATTFDVTARFKQSDVMTWSVVQRFTKLYKVDPEDEEFPAADTSLRVGYQLFPSETGPAGTGISLGAEATLPTSQFSREQDIRTVLTGHVTATRDFGPVSLLLRPYGRFHVNRYKTMDKDDSGTTVVRYRLGILFDATVELPHDLSLTSSNQWVERHYEDPPYGSHAPDHDYSFDLSLGYEFDAKTSFAVGYSQGNRAEQLGTVDVYLFDEETTQYYVSASREF
ncbi:hypothetical protein [Oligoflexus tunisiensis]|uniref:hypothetical protein n=1 Tax=Oligoflexus tunisiensis TaxID=708132 RepID=UPI00114CCA38|nr:hypothetical protein [Oligoflexus tunisiensis]